MAAALSGGIASASPPRVKPRLRGWSHEVAFFAALPAGIALVASHGAGPGRWPVWVYAPALALLFGVSALYHRPMWQPRARVLMQRVDHVTIFLLVAATYTAFGSALPHSSRVALLWVAWIGALSGSALTASWPSAPKWVSAAPYLALGWAAVAFLPAIGRALGAHVLAWIIAGGLLYTAGALAYVFRRPDPWPRVFGYHEIFHALVIAAAACHFVAVATALARAS